MYISLRRDTTGCIQIVNRFIKTNLTKSMTVCEWYFVSCGSWPIVLVLDPDHRNIGVSCMWRWASLKLGCLTRMCVRHAAEQHFIPIPESDCFCMKAIEAV